MKRLTVVFTTTTCYQMSGTISWVLTKESASSEIWRKRINASRIPWDIYICYVHIIFLGDILWRQLLDLFRCLRTVIDCKLAHSSGLEAKLVEKILHGGGEDLVDGDLAPPVLHPDVGAPLQQLAHHLLNTPNSLVLGSGVADYFLKICFNQQRTNLVTFT
jgi:hypothetical protein